MFQGKEGGKAVVSGCCGGIMEYMNVVCDGKDYSGVLKKYKCHSILFANISSYAGGTHPWNKTTPNFKPPSMNDGLIEVIALDHWDLPLLQMGGHGVNICQCKEAIITTKRALPMQIDGEPFMIRPCSITINTDILQTPAANMLVRDKRNAQAHHDQELEEWAATTIQRSFRKTQSAKSLSLNNCKSTSQ